MRSWLKSFYWIKMMMIFNFRDPWENLRTIWNICNILLTQINFYSKMIWIWRKSKASLPSKLMKVSSNFSFWFRIVKEIWINYCTNIGIMVKKIWKINYVFTNFLTIFRWGDSYWLDYIDIVGPVLNFRRTRKARVYI